MTTPNPLLNALILATHARHAAEVRGEAPAPEATMAVKTTAPVEHLFRGGGREDGPRISLVPRPKVDPALCRHIYIDAQHGALDQCARCGASIRWEPNGSGGWRAVAADSTQ